MDGQQMSLLRYLQLTKAEIVERLLAVEQAYAESQEQLARFQFELIEIQHEQEEKQRSHKPHMERKYNDGVTAQQE